MEWIVTKLMNIQSNYWSIESVAHWTVAISCSKLCNFFLLWFNSLHCLTGAPLLVVFVILYRKTALICLPLAGFSAKRSLIVLKTASLFSWTIFSLTLTYYFRTWTTEMGEETTTTTINTMNERMNFKLTSKLSYRINGPFDMKKKHNWAQLWWKRMKNGRENSSTAHKFKIKLRMEKIEYNLNGVFLFHWRRKTLPNWNDASKINKILELNGTKKERTSTYRFFALMNVVFSLYRGAETRL